jgi:hypothetical protein
MAKPERSIFERAKELLPDPRLRIEFDSFVNENLRRALAALAVECFPVSAGVGPEDFVKRIAAYEAAIRDVQTIAILLARWGDAEGIFQIEKILARIADASKGGGGTVVWLRLAWYPLVVLMYVAGITALAARRFDALRVALATPVLTGPLDGTPGAKPLVIPTFTAITDIADKFKWLPGHETDRYPRSEHLCHVLRPILEEALFLGRDYERLFDHFEVLLALAFADFRDPSGDNCWGPPGRFAYKERRGDSPMAALIDEAQLHGDAWPPLATGLFGGKCERFLKVAGGYKQLLDRHGRL